MVKVSDLDIIPLASESLGTRSMAVALRGKESQFVIDPGVDVAPRRYDLPPHSVELKRRKEHREYILQTIKEMPVAGYWVSHYHNDHFPKINPAIKIGKALYHFDPKLQDFPNGEFLIKHPKENLNKNQTKRARRFVSALKKLKINFTPAENVIYNTPEFSIKGSPLLSHGEPSLIGHVVGCSVVFKDTKLCYTGDVVGIPLDEHVNWIVEEQPDILIIDGPMKEQLEAFKENIKIVIDKTEIKQILIEHHLLRSGNWKELIADQIDYIQSAGTKISCYAELLGKKIELLEVERKNLFEFLPESAPVHTKGYKRKKKKL